MWGYPGLEELIDAYEHCEKCPVLCESRNNVVFGSGSSKADIMIIAEGPASVEDEVGIPLVGPSGRLLMNLLLEVWPEDPELEKIKDIEDDEVYFDKLRNFLDDHIFWTNLVMCRPPESRNPTTAEVKACKDRLQKTIYAVDPMLILAFGKLAASAMVGKTIGITARRGDIFDCTIPSPVTGDPIRYPVMALLHPSFLLRKGDQQLAITKKKGSTWDTLEDLRNALNLVNTNYNNLFGTEFPDRPTYYKES